MPTVTVAGAGNATITYTSNDSAPYSNALTSVIGQALTNGVLRTYTYTSGSTAPGPASGTGGVAIISTIVTTPVTIPTTDSATIITATTPTSIRGGAAGQTVVAGSGGLTFTNITPSGPNAVTYVSAGDGPNLITTTPGTTGNYDINTGAGNDTISVSGNALINAGTGQNSISVTGGASFIYSEGNDSITGSTVTGGGGTDTVNVGSGQTTINPGTTNFLIYGDPGTNPILFNAGSGSDSVSVGRGGGTVTGGTGGNNILYAGAGGPNGATTTLLGTANGDQLYASGNTVVFATAGAGNETISGAGGTPTGGVSVLGSTANNTFRAGSGNDTLIAGAGNDTLIGGTGTALMLSGTGADTFAFTFGTGGKDTITGFTATDTLQLIGYGVSTLPTTTAGGSTIISLADGTTIQLSGVSSLNPNQVVLK